MATSKREGLGVSNGSEGSTPRALPPAPLTAAPTEPVAASAAAVSAHSLIDENTSGTDESIDATFAQCRSNSSRYSFTLLFSSFLQHEFLTDASRCASLYSPAIIDRTAWSRFERERHGFNSIGHAMVPRVSGRTGAKRGLKTVQPAGISNLSDIRAWHRAGSRVCSPPAGCDLPTPSCPLCELLPNQALAPARPRFRRSKPSRVRRPYDGA